VTPLKDPTERLVGKVKAYKVGEEAESA